MRALSIRQPYAELILRGIKTVEYRSRSTTILGERFWIYASKKPAAFKGDARRGIAWSDDLQVASPPEWMLELAAQVKLIPSHIELPLGVIVGSAVIEKVTPVPASANADLLYRWHLAEVRRETTLRKPARHPQPAWFNPF